MLNYQMCDEEKKYLNSYNIADYERPSVAADIVTFAVMQDGQQDNIRKLANRELKVLLIKRGQFPYRGMWALPGGFVRFGEDVEDTARRELTEETGVSDPFLHLSGVCGNAGRDPRGWIISNSFISLINAEECHLRADTDAWNAAWFTVKIASERISQNEELSINTVKYRHYLTLEFDSDNSKSNIEKEGSESKIIRAVVTENRRMQGYNTSSSFETEESGDLAFDHAKIITKSVIELRNMVDSKIELVFSLLPDDFTLAQLQETVEKIMDKELLTANFRRKISDYVEETGKILDGAGHRPAKLFRVRRNSSD